MTRVTLLLASLLLCIDCRFLCAREAPFKVLHADAGSHGTIRKELVGNVIVERDGIKLYADRMVYDSDSEVIEAWGSVEIRDPAFHLTCSRLTLTGKSDEAVAWGSPRLLQRERRGTVVTETTLSGVQIRMFIKERRVHVLENVLLSRYDIVGGTRTVELRVRCRSLDALTAAKRSTFKGGVVIETPTVGAAAERALFDQLTEKFYLIGRAQAWNFDSSGRKVNLIEGEKIIYFTKQKRTVVIGNVTADVEPEVKTGARPIPLRDSPVTRPGEVIAHE